MKRQFTLLLAALLLLMTACGTTEPKPTETAPATTAAATVVTESTEPYIPTTAPERLPPYTVDIYRPDYLVWDGPSYDNCAVATVEEAGVYTIVSETTDGEGNLWGELKSGLGWVDLTLLAAEEAEPPVISGSFQKNREDTEENCHYCSGDTTGQPERITLRIYETMYDAVFYSMKFEEDFVKDQQLLQLETWEPRMPLVADISFPGDMSTYGIRFQDADGRLHEYRISVSGRNGSLILTEAK